MKSIVIFLLVFLHVFSHAQTPVDTAFTYQGNLTLNGANTTGTYDINFVLFDQSNSGNIMADVVAEDVVVNNSLFTTTIDFGDLPFSGDERWLEIRVREGASIGGFQQLLPRQNITSSPYAIQAQFVNPDAVTTTEISDGTIIEADIAANSITLSLMSDQSVGTDELIDAAVITSKLANDSVATAKIVDLSVTTTKVADDAINQAKIADAAVGADEIIASEVQLRISESCSVGTVIQNINQDGTVDCVNAGLELTPFNGSILSPEQQQKLNRWSGDDKQVWQRCYQLSTDTQTSATFHTQCDNKGPSVTVIQGLNGQVFGGYTENSWSATFGSYRGYDESFLYVLAPTVENFPIGHHYQSTTFNRLDYGPTFGNGHDIYINANMKLAYCNFPYAYSCDGVSAASPSNTCTQRLCGIDSVGTTGTVNLDLAEIEVWVQQN